jgi:hypothetical protein
MNDFPFNQLSCRHRTCWPQLNLSSSVGWNAVPYRESTSFWVTARSGRLCVQERHFLTRSRPGHAGTRSTTPVPSSIIYPLQRMLQHGSMRSKLVSVGLLTQQCQNLAQISASNNALAWLDEIKTGLNGTTHSTMLEPSSNIRFNAPAWLNEIKTGLNGTHSAMPEPSLVTSPPQRMLQRSSVRSKLVSMELTCPTVKESSSIKCPLQKMFQHGSMRSKLVSMGLLTQ